MLLTASEVAGILRIHPNTLYAWRSQGKGPNAVVLGRSIRFRREDVDAWIVEQGEGDGGDRDASPDVGRGK